MTCLAALFLAKKPGLWKRSSSLARRSVGVHPTECAEGLFYALRPNGVLGSLHRASAGASPDSGYIQQQTRI